MSIRVFSCVGLLAGLLLPAAAEDKPPSKADYREFAKLIQAAVVPHIPKEFEDKSQWGKTIPDPGDLRLNRLRMRIRVGDKEELPDGPWSRTRVVIDNPARDVQIEIRELRKIDPKIVKVQVATTVPFHAEMERKRWDKGLPLLGLMVQADATVTVVLDCDVGLSLNTSKFPPEVVVEPKVTRSQLELKAFELRQVGRVQAPERVRELSHEFKGVLEEYLKKKCEPQIKEKANEAIAHSLKEGKGAISASALLRAQPVKKE